MFDGASLPAGDLPGSICPQFSIESLMLWEMSMNREIQSAGVEAPGSGGWRSDRPALNMNRYANKKSAAESMLDVALLMANASQLKAVLDQGPGHAFHGTLIALISLSLALQVTVGVMLIFIVGWNLNDRREHWRLDVMEDTATCLVFFIVVLNILITAFGVQTPEHGV